MNYVNFNNGKMSSVLFKRAQDAYYAGSHQDNYTEGRMNKNTQISNFNALQPQPANWNRQETRFNHLHQPAALGRKETVQGQIRTFIDPYGHVMVDSKKFRDRDLRQTTKPIVSKDDVHNHDYTQRCDIHCGSLKQIRTAPTRRASPIHQGSDNKVTPYNFDPSRTSWDISGCFIENKVDKQDIRYRVGQLRKELARLEEELHTTDSNT